MSVVPVTFFCNPFYCDFFSVISVTFPLLISYNLSYTLHFRRFYLFFISVLSSTSNPHCLYPCLIKFSSQKKSTQIKIWLYQTATRNKYRKGNDKMIKRQFCSSFHGHRRREGLYFLE